MADSGLGIGIITELATGANSRSTLPEYTRDIAQVPNKIREAKEKARQAEEKEVKEEVPNNLVEQIEAEREM